MSGYVVPAVLCANGLAAGAFAIDSNMATAIGVLVSTVAVIWAIIKWVDSRIGEQVKALELRTTVQLNHHNELVVGKLKQQDQTAEANQALLLEKLKSLNDKIPPRHKP